MTSEDNLRELAPPTPRGLRRAADTFPHVVELSCRHTIFYFNCYSSAHGHISLDGSGALTDERGTMGQGSQKLLQVSSSWKFGGQRESLVSFATEKPGQPSSFQSCASGVHLKPAHNPRICPFPPSFADPLFTVNNPQEIVSDGCGSPEVRARLPGWSDFFWCLPCFSSILFFCCVSCSEG